MRSSRSSTWVGKIDNQGWPPQTDPGLGRGDSWRATSAVPPREPASDDPVAVGQARLPPVAAGLLRLPLHRARA